MEDEHPISSPRGVSSLAAAGAPDSSCPDESQHYKVSGIFIFILLPIEVLCKFSWVNTESQKYWTSTRICGSTVVVPVGTDKLIF